jgi:hypothetical protein
MLQPLLALFLCAQPELPQAPPPRPAGLGLLPGEDPSLADWTPRPALGHFEPWERMTDQDWIDGRFREMQTGPVLNCTMRHPFERAQATVYKASVVKLGAKGEAGAVFDRATLRLSAAWSGGFLNISDRRFGLLNTPTPKGRIVFDTAARPGWYATEPGTFEGPRAPPPPYTAPLPKEWARYRGMYLHGDRVVFKFTVGDAEVLESFSYEKHGELEILASHVTLSPSKKQLRKLVYDSSTRALHNGGGPDDTTRVIQLTGGRDPILIGTVGKRRGSGTIGNPGIHALWDPSEETRHNKILVAKGGEKEVEAFTKVVERAVAPEDLTKLTRGGPKRWGEPIVTKLERGTEDGPFAVDTLTIPYKNRFGALFFCTGLDFLKDGRIAVCTAHGDVWLVTVDERAGTCSWQRYATGLYQPLGLKVVDGKVIVLERGQLTRLHDLNNDGEADFYECISNDWHTGSGEHSYDTCLETDARGNFYFFKTGDTDTPTGGTLLKLSADGTKSEIYCTGFRHPIGLGISPGGIITGADQEGNWMPATRIDEYQKGGFYGDMRAHHRTAPPTIYDPPLCWLPREIDNSAGGQVWVPKDAAKWGALAGLPLHFSYGRCKAFVLLRQELPAPKDSTPAGSPLPPRVQGGAAALGVEFLSGVCRGRFGPDGHLYACGLNGWQTAARADGSVQRVRATGKPVRLPTALEVQGKTIRLTLSCPLDAKVVADATNYRAAWWNYHWSGDYGSKRWKVSDPKAEGQDDVPVRSAKLLADGCTVELTFDALQPVMQMMVGYHLKGADGKPVVGSVYLTIHSTGN